MTTKFLMTLVGFAILSSCSKNDPNENTTPADYVETHEKLIQNKGKDSLEKDSANGPTAMPPQAKHSEDGH